ncbi:uncharacterized protein LOC115679456 [Syzygium oleosum]|uniref:uncharacterized protein LOC115679456 n=1 Tax=Syzygium oleosum TaxID=219896 RepID=UPI0011D19E0A|nr:uncharacterized protein LOC115679456 [Syzygium oleosum]
MAAIRFALAISFVILTLLSRSAGSLADQAISHRQRRQQPSSHDVSSSVRARRIGTRVVKKLSGGGGVGGGGGRSGGGGGSGGGGFGGGSGGGGRGGGGGGCGGGPIGRTPGSVVRPVPTGTDGPSAVSSGPSTLVGSVVSCSSTLI